jgi:tetratricopeptide (TPR) repeat protein
MYVAAAENLYRIDPGPESAHNLAILFITRNDFEKAASYLKEAVLGESTNPETRAEWYYELAVISNAQEDYCEAIGYARESIKLKGDYGKPYVALGDAFIASRDNLGDDFQQRTAFWAATDMYKKAISTDPSLAGETNKKLNIYARQYPNSEEVFFRDMKDGDSYKVEGCIKANTTVRSRK